MPSSTTSPQRIRLFRSERLEKLTMISPRTFAVSWAVMLPLIAWVAWGSAEPLHAAALIVAGLVVWTLFEYAMHRYLFHLDSRFAVVRWMVFLMHGNHHDCPNDRLRGLMPLPVSVSIGSLIWMLCVLALGPAGSWMLFGFMTGYVIYDALHFACHQYPMRSGIGAMFKRHHMRHHHVDEDGNFSISALFWDRLFGTRITSLKR